VLTYKKVIIVGEERGRMTERILKRAVVACEEAGRMSSEDRRCQLMRVAIKLFSRKGFRGTTTKEIALASGVTEAMIFRHFLTKEDLYRAILDHKASEEPVEEFLKELGEFTERKDDEGLFLAIATKILGHAERDPDFMRLMFYSALEGHELARSFREKQFKPMNDFVAAYVSRRQAEGVFRKINPTVAVRSFVGMAVHHWLFTRLLEFHAVDVTDQEAAKLLTNIFLNGLRKESSPVGRARAQEPARKQR
jgi:AcrR family transcriptional regulator